jgi:hypothetical protein
MKAFSTAGFAVIAVAALSAAAQAASFESFVKSYYDGEYAAVARGAGEDHPAGDAGRRWSAIVTVLPHP